MTDTAMIRNPKCTNNDLLNFLKPRLKAHAIDLLFMFKYASIKKATMDVKGAFAQVINSKIVIALRNINENKEICMDL